MRVALAVVFLTVSACANDQSASTDGTVVAAPTTFAPDCEEFERHLLKRIEAIDAVLGLRENAVDAMRAEYETLKELTEDLPQPVSGARIGLLFDINEFEDGGTEFVLQVPSDSGNAFELCPV